VLRPYVVGKTVHDLGAGRLHLAKELLGLGAERVIAVDRLPRDSDDPRIEQHTSLFEEYKATIETAFGSWPHPKVSALTPLVQRTPLAIILAKVADSTVCGTACLWAMLSKREVLAYVPMKRNSLIVYGAALIERPPLPEEVARVLRERQTPPFAYLQGLSSEELTGLLRAPRGESSRR
jgi:hypothetical protein